MLAPCVNTLLIDFHGVMTDGRQSVSQDGRYLFDHVHTRDTRAIRELVARGYRVVILTASGNPIITAFAERMKVELHVVRDKSSVLEQYLPFIAVGDDAWDVQMLEKAERAFCPLDADISVRSVEGVEVLDVLGGYGCLAEVLHKLAATGVSPPDVEKLI